jgi:ribulose kinase
MEDIYLGIDVGTGSVRVGAFDSIGNLKGSASRISKSGAPVQIL